MVIGSEDIMMKRGEKRGDEKRREKRLFLRREDRSRHHSPSTQPSR
jgi:hypothetical protein